MYYKVIQNQKVIDVLDSLRYVKYQLKHRILLLCDNKAEAQGVLSSSGNTAYHTSEYLPFPCDDFPTVTLEEITKEEYESLARLHLRTPEEIAQEIIMDLMKRGVF